MLNTTSNEKELSDVMTVKELAAYLKCSEFTVRNWVRDKNIPYFKVANLVRFSKHQIANWASSRANPVFDEDGYFVRGTRQS